MSCWWRYIALFKEQHYNKTKRNKGNIESSYTHGGVSAALDLVCLFRVVALCCLVNANVLLYQGMYVAALCRADCRLCPAALAVR